MSKKILIVGGVAGGASTAARLRRLDEEAEIIMFERGEFISFANCGLPYYIGDVIKRREALLVQTLDGMTGRFNMDIRVFSEVTKINPEEKKVSVRNLKTGEEYEESYDKLVLSPGASPLLPPIPGIDKAKNLFTLRNIPDTDAIKSYIDENKPQSALVVGGGFIGIEMVENLHRLGIKVSLVEALDQVMGPIDFEMASILHKHIRDKGVDLILADGVKSFEDEGRRLVLESGREIESDMTIFSIGVRPESQLAREAGLKIGETGGILVNQYLETSKEDIYAIGDAIEVTDLISANKALIPLAGPANKQGRIVANNICGEKEEYPGSLGTSIAQVFDLVVASTGNNEKMLRARNTPYKVAHVNPNSHSGYYPNASPINMKILFDGNTGRILGAQAIGSDGVDKAIDVIATAIAGNLKVMDLQGLELAYAPPFSSAKNPVNMLGFVATNIMEGKVDTVQWHEINKIVEDGGVLVDVNAPFARKHLGFIKGSISIPLTELRDRLEELPRDKTIYTCCQTGLTSYIGARILMQNGFNVKNLDGGMAIYKNIFDLEFEAEEDDDWAFLDEL